MVGQAERQTVFVQGKCQDRKTFIQLQLEKDSVVLRDDEISISIDIDSVIWVTYHLQVKGHIYLHLLPLLREKPPFSTNNHIYIQVLLPPTKEDRATYQTSRQSKKYPISHIPHTHFGQIGHGSGQFNIYIFFPRMIRRDPRTRRMVTLIPQEVQDLWFSQVIIPASELSLKNYPGIAEYLSTDIDHLRWKMGDQRGVKTIPFAHDILQNLQTTLRRLISYEPDLLGRFGSFFFVIDSRGLKLLSKQCDKTLDIYQSLCSTVPCLDWNYMSDRSNGELFLDLGISYHPPIKNEPLVGLWRLGRIRDSYDLMGMKKGTTHHACTFAGYGGMQAEMKQKRSDLVHLCFRSTYNLCYEVVRHPSQTEYLCQDLDAIKVNEKFLTGCLRWKSLFNDAARRSFGVREEIRGSGLAVVKLLDVVLEKVRGHRTSSFYQRVDLLDSPGKRLSPVKAHDLD
jgi:hypothetical protein